MLRNLSSLHQISQRAISSSSRRSMLNKVAEKQKLFQDDNGIPIYIKGGLSDRLLFRTTMVLSLVGTGYAVYELLMAAVPKK